MNRLASLLLLLCFFLFLSCGDAAPPRLAPQETVTVEPVVAEAAANDPVATEPPVAAREGTVQVPWGEAEVEYYRRLHAGYRNRIVDAVKARDKEWLLRATKRFNESVVGELLIAQVVSMADPAHPEVLFSKAFAERLLAAIHHVYSDKVHVTRLKDAVQVESNVNPDGTWPDGLRITLLFKLPARLQFSIEAARKEYTRGTPILVRIRLHNADAEPYVLTAPLPEGAPPAPMRGLGWGRGLGIYGAAAAEEFKELPRDAPHGDTELGPLYMPVYRFKGLLDPGGSQSILHFIRRPEFPAGVRRFQAVLYLRGRKIETPEIAVEIREATEQDLALFTPEERRTINWYAAGLHNHRRGNRELSRERLRILPVVRKALRSKDKTVDCEYALYMGVLPAVDTRNATPDDVALAKRAGEALLKRFPDSWLGPPVRDALAKLGADEPGAAAEASVKLRRVHLFISGRVQGVGFRAFTRREALKRGLVGWVRNLNDGRVEAVVEGGAEKVAELIEAVKHGPANARVDKVEVSDEKPEGKFKTFQIRYPYG